VITATLGFVKSRHWRWFVKRRQKWFWGGDNEELDRSQFTRQRARKNSGEVGNNGLRLTVDWKALNQRDHCKPTERKYEKREKNTPIFKPTGHQWNKFRKVDE